MSKYTIGIDFGTLSGRALLVDTSDGREIATSVYEYPHGVMDRELPSGKKLPQDWALEHPEDYLGVLKNAVPAVLSGIDPADVIGVGIDFTTCTVVAAKADSTPVCCLPEFENEPHAYVKLWKHHSAEPEARELSRIARERGEKWLPLYGGKVSSEFMLPKIWEVLNDAPHVFEATDIYLDAADWVGWKLTGSFTRSIPLSCFKMMYTPEDGFPTREYLRALDPRLEDLSETKLTGRLGTLGTSIGTVSPEMAKLTGLTTNTVVSTGAGDGHASPLAMKAVRPGRTSAILGTSGVYIALSEEFHDIPGVFTAVYEGITPGYWSYELGQACVGDHFSWFVKNCTPQSYFEEAERAGKSIHALLNEKAAALRPGESGIIALDWWNGNRSILSDSELSGMLIGMTMTTRPEEIYRALIEATAFGAKKILDSLTEHGVPTEALYATGGICDKSPFIMQTYADILGIPIRLSGTANGSALGAAILAATAAGGARGGYDDFFAAAESMGNVREFYYSPNEDNAEVYGELYKEYIELHDYFGRGSNPVMKHMKRLREKVRFGQ